MLEVQEFLHNNLNQPEELKSILGIKVKRHPKYQNLILCNYSQIDSPKSHPVVQECRGIILDEDAGYSPVNFPYKRFFNYGEGLAVEIDWSTARVQDKLDGTLACVWFYDGEWRVSTRGTPDASGNVGDWPFNFNELFWKTWNELGYKMPDNQDCCYMFELMTKFNKIIVRHEESKIVLHGARNLKTMLECDPVEVGARNKWEVVKSHPLGTFEEVVAFAATINPMHAEGFVVVDGLYRRVKVKSPQYVALSSLQEGFGPRRMLEMVLTNESEEFLTYFSEYKPVYDKILENWKNVTLEIESMYNKHKDIEDQKQFALKIKDTRYSGVLFSIRAGKFKNVDEAMRNMTIKSLEELLNVKNEEFGKEKKYSKGDSQ